MELSIVTTMYNSAPYLEEFYGRICSAADKITSNYEIIFVNDGSPDNSLDIAVSLFEKDSRVRVINLSRNFGHHKAIMTGLNYARGELIFLIDSDLEENPELLGKFYDEYKSSDANVVYGIQGKRKGGGFEQISGNFFYWIFNILSSFPLPRNPLTVRLMSRRYTLDLLKHQERETILGGLFAVTGYKQVPLVVNKQSTSRTTYTFWKKIALFVNGITSFSNRPLVYIFYLGCAISFLSSAAAFYLIVRRLFFGIMLTGWPSLIVSVWLLGGLSLFCLGIIGIYLSKVFMETKQRPYTVIEKVYDWSGGGEKQFIDINQRTMNIDEHQMEKNISDE
jgi:putative glycosyltransferase